MYCMKHGPEFLLQCSKPSLNEMPRPLPVLEKQIEDQYLGRIISSFAFKFVNEFIHVLESTPFHESGAVWAFREFLTGPVPSSTKSQITLKSNTASKQELTTMCYTGRVRYFMECYATDTPIDMANKEICIFKQGSLALYDFSQNIP